MGLVAWLVAAPCHGLLGQSQPQAAPQAPFTLEVTARTVTLDVVVTDRKGEPVSDLSRDDFSIFDNNLQQTIRYYRAHHGSSPDSAAGMRDAHLRDDGPADTPVTMIVLDELSMSFEDKAFAAYSLQTYLSQQAETLSQPTLLLSARLGRLEVICDYTRSKTRILHALKERLNASPWPEHSGNQLDDQINASLSALVAMAQASMGHPGRKSVVWIGRGFPAITPGSLDPQSAASLEQALHTCIDLMMQTRMTLYTIDPAGLTVAQSTNDQGDTTSDPLDGQVDFSTIARSTGGKAFAGRNDVHRLIGLSTNEADNFYTLAYTPNATSAEEQRFHAVRVVMKKRDWTATTRSGYYTTPPTSPSQDGAGDSASRSEYDLELAAHTTLAFDGIPMHITRTPSQPDLFSITIPESAIRWQDATNGERSAEIYLLAESFDKDDRLLHHTAKLVTAKLPATSTVPSVHVLVQVPTGRPAVRLRFAVVIAATGKVGAENFLLSSADRSR